MNRQAKPISGVQYPGQGNLIWLIKTDGRKEWNFVLYSRWWIIVTSRNRLHFSCSRE